MSDAPSWDLQTLCPGGPGGRAFSERSAAARAEVAALRERASALAPSLAEHGAEWARMLCDAMEASPRLGELSAFAFCSYAANTKSTTARLARDAMHDLWTDFDGVWVRLDGAILAADDAVFEAWCATDELEPCRPWIRTRRAGRALALPLPEEELYVALQREAVSGWGQLYDLVSGDLRAELQVHGSSRTAGIAELASMRADPDEEVRRAAFRAGTVAWTGVRDVCAAALTHITGARQTRADRVGVDVCARTLYRNRVTPPVLDALWAASDALQGPLVAYLERKAALLGKPRLDWWDLDAPLAPAEAAQRSFSHASDAVCSSFARLSPELADFARRALDARWIEAESRAGKKQGGFCASFGESRESRIFMTYTGSLDNALTLAHELGHAYHNEVLFTQPAARRQVTSALAETASTFAEAVCRDALLAEASSPQTRVFMLDQQLQAGVVFLMNIRARFAFERRLFALRRDGALHPDVLSEEMVACQQAAYCGALGTWNDLFWASKLHFYIARFGFYNWPYTFGYLFSAAVYARAQEEGPAFLPVFRDLLVRTGWQDARSLARETLGVELEDPEFWIGAARPLEGMVAEFLAETA